METQETRRKEVDLWAYAYEACLLTMRIEKSYLDKEPESSQEVLKILLCQVKEAALYAIHSLALESVRTDTGISGKIGNTEFTVELEVATNCVTLKCGRRIICF